MSQPSEPKPKNGNGNGNGVPLLPKWFATKGPRPGWLAEYWSMILASISGIVVFINTVVLVNITNKSAEIWINAAVAWVASLALFLQGRKKSVENVAKWRAKVRAEEAAKNKEDDDGVGTAPTD